MSPSCAADPVDSDIHCQMNGIELSIPKALLFGPATLVEQDGQAEPPQAFPHINQFSFSLDPISYQPIDMVHSMDLGHRLPRSKEEFVKEPILVSVMILNKNRADIDNIPRTSYLTTASSEYAGGDPFGHVDEKTGMYSLNRSVEVNSFDEDAIYLSKKMDLLVSCERLIQTAPPYADISKCHGTFVFKKLTSSVGFYFSRVDLENVHKIKDAIFHSISVFIMNRGNDRG